MADALEAIKRRIFQARGIPYEADVFSILRHSPFIVRSFEFAPVDGAIDCSREYTSGQDYTSRLWDVLQRPKQQKPSQFALFEVKSTVAGEAGRQAYLTTTQQQRTVAFWIGICAADPTWVDVIPNFKQDGEALADDEEAEEEDIAEASQGKERGLSANSTRGSKLPASAYGGIDQCNAPYRMPIWLLEVAIERIRECITGAREFYVNPWTGVSFPNWRPITTTCTSHLHPAEGTQHYSAYEAVVDVLTAVNGVEDSRVRLDLVNLQPRLADFKLNNALIQQKVDPMPRAKGAAMTKVAIARGEGRDRGYFFSAFDRFDFLWYQFSIARYSGGPLDNVFYLLPERELPDEFYETLDKFVSFELESFQQYRIVMDRDGFWIDEVARIISHNPNPRASHERPVRKCHNYGEPLEEEAEETIRKIVAAAQKGPSKSKGRREYKEVLTSGQRRFFYEVMRQCAIRMSGLLLVLATNHPLGDFAFCRYTWTEAERNAFFSLLEIPCFAHQLSPDTIVVPICYYTQYAECGFQGPMVRAKQFRRLDSCLEPRLIAWDLGGFDTKDEMVPPILIPTDDISVTDAQRATFKLALTRKTNTPLLSAIISTGRPLAQYAVEHAGPAAYSESTWSAVWELLDRFTSTEQFQHPAAADTRHPSIYQHTLQSVHQRLPAEQGFEGLHEDAFEEDD